MCGRRWKSHCKHTYFYRRIRTCQYYCADNVDESEVGIQWTTGTSSGQRCKHRNSYIYEHTNTRQVSHTNSHFSFPRFSLPFHYTLVSNQLPILCQTSLENSSGSTINPAPYLPRRDTRTHPTLLYSLLVLLCLLPPQAFVNLPCRPTRTMSSLSVHFGAAHIRMGQALQMTLMKMVSVLSEFFHRIKWSTTYCIENPFSDANRASISAIRRSKSYAL